jgi:hypothetical protein
MLLYDARTQKSVDAWMQACYGPEYHKYFVPLHRSDAVDSENMAEAMDLAETTLSDRSSLSTTACSVAICMQELWLRMPAEALPPTVLESLSVAHEQDVRGYGICVGRIKHKAYAKGSTDIGVMSGIWIDTSADQATGKALIQYADLKSKLNQQATQATKNFLPKGCNAGVVNVKSFEQAGRVAKNSVINYFATAVMVAGLCTGDKATLTCVQQVREAAKTYCSAVTIRHTPDYKTVVEKLLRRSQLAVDDLVANPARGGRYKSPLRRGSSAGGSGAGSSAGALQPRQILTAPPPPGTPDDGTESDAATVIADDDITEQEADAVDSPERGEPKLKKNVPQAGISPTKAPMPTEHGSPMQDGGSAVMYDLDLVDPFACYSGDSHNEAETSTALVMFGAFNGVSQTLSTMISSLCFCGWLVVHRCACQLTTTTPHLGLPAPTMLGPASISGFTSSCLMGCKHGLRNFRIMVWTVA